MQEPTDPHPDARPRVVAGLRLVRRVGSGGEGEVWEARDPDGARRALKLIRPAFVPAADELARRGAYLRRIDHPALVRVQRTGRLRRSTLEGWGFVEMDFVDGEPLGQAPADPEALHRLDALAEGLDALHRGEWSDGVPLVHRDVKPANLISRADGGGVVLVDCSTLRSADVAHVTRIGTPVFAAPEVLTGKAGPPADVYAFAVTIVALVTGTRGEQLVRLLGDVERLELPVTVGQALSPDPDARPRSCRAVLEAGTEIDPELLPPLRMPAHGTAQGPDAARPAGVPAAEDAGGWVDEPAWEEDAQGVLTPWIFALAVTAALVWAATDGRGAVVELLGRAGLQPSGRWWLPAAGVGAYGWQAAAAMVAGQPWALALLCPPAAWAWLLGERAAGPGLRRAWVRVGLTGVLGAATVTVGLGVLDGAAVAGLPLGVAGTVAGGVGLAALSVVAGRAPGAGAALLRLLLAPAWLVGAVPLVVAGALAAVAGAPAGRAPAGGRLAAGTLASAGAFVGLAGRPRPRAGPDPRA